MVTAVSVPQVECVVTCSRPTLHHNRTSRCCSRLLRRLRPSTLALVLFLLSASCEKPEKTDFKARETKLYALTDTMGAAFEHHRVVAVTPRAKLVETSGAAMSTMQPGVFFTINDSGNEAFLFALDTMGRDRGAWRVTNAVNVDWEAISEGPCTVDVRKADPASYTSRCLYIADVGDNEGKRDSVNIYQVAEPVAQSLEFSDSVRAIRRSFTYADAPHDVEAMFVDKDGSINLITKRGLHTEGGKLRPALVFGIPASAWSSDDKVVATLIDSLPIILESALQRMITDAALSPDGRWLAVRTYRQLYVIEVNPVTGAIARSRPRVCNIFDLNELQGEGMTWVKPPATLLLTSEGRNEPLHILDCPLR